MNEIEMIPVRSSSIKSIGYGTAEMILRVKFLSGLVYDYLNVPENVFEEFLLSSSKGTYLNKKIKNKYRFKKLK
jgi:hypothetical protein